MDKDLDLAAYASKAYDTVLALDDPTRQCIRSHHKRQSGVYYFLIVAHELKEFLTSLKCQLCLNLHQGEEGHFSQDLPEGGDWLDESRNDLELAAAVEFE